MTHRGTVNIGEIQARYAVFIECIMAPFDETAESPALRSQAEHFRAVRACFLAGDVIEDEKIQEATIAFYRAARLVSDSLLREVDRSLALLAEYCEQTANARCLRLRGKIDAALRLEAAAQHSYEQLPEKYRW